MANRISCGMHLLDARYGRGFAQRRDSAVSASRRRRDQSRLPSRARSRLSMLTRRSQWTRTGLLIPTIIPNGGDVQDRPNIRSAHGKGHDETDAMDTRRSRSRSSPKSSNAYRCRLDRHSASAWPQLLLRLKVPLDLNYSRFDVVNFHELPAVGQHAIGHPGALFRRGARLYCSMSRMTPLLPRASGTVD